MNFVFWKAIIEEGYCVCLSMEGFEDSHKLKRGDPVQAYFPDDVFFRMDPDFPKDIMLPDSVRNGGGFVLVSNPLKHALEESVDDPVEYLSVKIINHKGRVATDAYFVVNPTSIYDAIDFTQSQVKWNNINPDQIASCKKLTLKHDAIPPEAQMFRLTHFPRRILLREDLAEKIKDRGYSGLAFTDVNSFKGF